MFILALVFINIIPNFVNNFGLTFLIYSLTTTSKSLLINSILFINLLQYFLNAFINSHIKILFIKIFSKMLFITIIA